MARNILVLCLLAALGVAYADEPEKLVSGTDVRPGEYPSVVSIQTNGWHFCCGTIISNKHILTAAHCVQPKINQEAKIQVVTGATSLKQGGEIHRVSKMSYHPQYSPSTNGVNWYYDIAVIELADPITFNQFQNKALLPTKTPVAYSRANAVAWGSTGFRGKMSDSLQKLEVSIVPKDTCQKYHNVPITDVMICTYKSVNAGTCHGDSGSGLLQGPYIIGVVSGGIPCATGRPDIFTNVHHVLNYVRNAMA